VIAWTDFALDFSALLALRYWLWPVCLRERLRYLSAAISSPPPLTLSVRKLDAKLALRPFAAHIGGARSPRLRLGQINSSLRRGRAWRNSSFQSMATGYRRPSPQSL